MRQAVRSALEALLLILASVCIALTSAEVVLRALGHHGEPMATLSNIYQVDDPVLDWRYIPNSEVHQGDLVYRFNRAGFRDVDHSTEKPRGVRRIVVPGIPLPKGTA